MMRNQDMSPYTCRSSGIAGSTLSPRRGGVSPAMRSVADPTAAEVGLTLGGRACSGCARERSRSAPSN